LSIISRIVYQLQLS